MNDVPAPLSETCVSNVPQPVRGSADLNRRDVVRGVGALIAAPAIIIPGRARAAGRRIVVANFGGVLGTAKRKALYDPFTRETGIEVIAVPGVDLARMKLQVSSGQNGWDVVDLLPDWLPTAIRLGLLERIDQKSVDRHGCIASARSDHAVGGSIFTAGIGYAEGRKGTRAPRDWPEFWNTRAFPGRRALLRRIPSTLEIALMADGVPASSVYPCDVDRAFRSLDRIRDSVNHWIGQTQQTVSLISQDETDFAFTYSTRVRSLRQAGARIGFSFSQNILGVLWTGILKGTPNLGAALQLCAYIADPIRQAALSNLTGDAPCDPAALAYVSPQARVWLPRIDQPGNLFSDAAWWDRHLDDLTVRFQEWLFA